jgi:hypothetical protein
MAENFRDINRPSEALTALVAAAPPEQSMLIADLVLPPIFVDPENGEGKIKVIDTRPLRGRGNQQQLRRGYMEKYPAVGVPPKAFHSYDCEEISLASYEEWRTWKRIKKDKRPAHLRYMVALANLPVRIEREHRVAALLNDAALWMDNTDDYLNIGDGVEIGGDGAKEISNLEIAYRRATLSAGGRKPPVMFIGGAVFSELRSGTQFMAQGPRDVDKTLLDEETLITLLKKWFKLRDVFIGEMMSEEAQDGEDSSQDYIWRDSIGFIFNDIAPTETSTGLLVTTATAVQIVERDTADGDSPDGYWGIQRELENPRAMMAVGGISQDQVFLNEYDTNAAGETAKKLSPRGYLVTNCLAVPA